ncbi:peptidylprolyl isomerase [bacterium]|nr:peptidylprolyl isomerase [bacterium]
MIRNRHLAGFFVVILTLITLIAGCGKNDSVVVFFDKSDNIMLSELKTRMLAGRDESQWAKFSDLEVNAYLQRMIDNKLLKIGSLEADVKERDEYKARYIPIYQNLVLRTLYSTQVLDKIIPPSDLRDFYAHSQYRVQFKDIVIKFPTNPTTEQKDSVQHESMEIYKRLKKGEDFTFLAGQFSQHENSKTKDALVGYVNWTTDRDPVRHALWDLKKGEISKPVENSKGYHILQAAEIEPVEVKPFEQEKERINNILQRERQGKIAERTRAFWEDVKADNDVSYNEELLNEWLEIFKSVSPMISGTVLDSIESLPAEKISAVIVSSKVADLTIETVLEKLRTVPEDTELRIGTVDIFKEFFERKLQADLLTKKAEQLGIHKRKNLKDKIEAASSESMRKIFEEDLYGDVVVDDEALLAHYEATKEVKYKTKELRKIQEIMIKDEAFAKKIYRRAKAGENFGRLAKKYTERAKHKEIQGEFIWFGDRSWAEIGRQAFKMKKGEIAEPVFYQRGNAFSIIKLTGIRPPEYKPYDKNKTKIESDLIRQIKFDIKKAWITVARERYNVTIAKEVISNANRK